MKKEELFELMGQIDESYIAEAGGKDMKTKKERNRVIIKWAAGVAAAVVISIILPNINADIAMAMGNIPVLGKYFQVVTFREYHYEDGNNSVDLLVPKIETEEGATEQEKNTAQSMNKSIEEYAQGFMKEFEENLKSQGEGYQELQMDYEVVTDTQKWLTIKVNALQVQASGYQQAKFFHIDKTTGKEAVLSDLFVEGSDYIGVISQDIIRQMKEQMAGDEGKVYFFEGDDDDIDEDDFSRIKEEQNFYFNEAGELVIAFDEYEVAPGFMGTVEFVIPSQVISDILK